MNNYLIHVMVFRRGLYDLFDLFLWDWFCVGFVLCGGS